MMAVPFISTLTLPSRLALLRTIATGILVEVLPNLLLGESGKTLRRWQCFQEFLPLFRRQSWEILLEKLTLEILDCE